MKLFISNKDFQKAALEYAFNQQSKPKGFSDLKQVFIDSNGKRYFRFMNPFQLPVLRNQQFDRVNKEMQRKLSNEELNKFITDFKLELNRLVYESKAVKAGVYTPVSKMGFLIEELEKREEILIHIDSYFDMAAVVTIREDEVIDDFDADIHNEKIEQFKKDSTGGLRDFFYNLGLSPYLDFLEVTTTEFDQFLTNSNAKIQAQKTMLEQFISEAKLSSSSESKNQD